MATIIQNLNSIITTKNELNSILQENGVDGGEIFSEYPQKFRTVIASSGGGGVSYSYLNEKLTYYVEKDELYNSSYATQSYVVDYVNTYAPTPDLSAYATKSYVADYVATYAPQPDLSSYVTYSYAYSEYVNYGYLGDLEEITDYIIGSGSPSSPENVYATKYELSSYVSYSYLESKHYLDSIPNTYATYEAISGMGYLTSIPSDYATYAAISEMSYATQSYVVDYVAEHGGGGSTVIDENIIPKENNTYTLGDRTHNYKATYTSSLKSNDSGITIQINDNNKYYISSSVIRPITTNSVNLGTNDYKWLNTYSANTYTENLYSDTAYTNRVNFGTNKVYIYNNGDTQMKFGVNNADRFRIDYNTFAPSISGAVTQLGTSNNPFTNTYTSYLYLGSSNIKDLINGMFSYDSSTGTLTITTLS